VTAPDAVPSDSPSWGELPHAWGELLHIEKYPRSLLRTGTSYKDVDKPLTSRHLQKNCVVPLSPGTEVARDDTADQEHLTVICPATQGITMEITEEAAKQIEQIIEELECPRGFECYTSKFEKLAAVDIAWFTELVSCRSREANYCPLTFNFGFGPCCTCPLRHYVARYLRK